MRTVSLALFVYYVVFLLVTFAWPTWRLWRREHVNAFVIPSDDTAEGVIGLWLKAIVAAIGLLLVLLILRPDAGWLGPLAWLEGPLAVTVGWSLLGVSLFWIALAQRQMGRSWRVGIDQEQRGPLVHSGLFKVSRNPIFLGIRVNLLGLFLLVPNGVTLAIGLVGEALIQVQVRLEEQHLSRALGDGYDRYRASVRRWI